MEGILALGTVSSLIQIIDKGIELVSEVKEIYRAETGASALHQRIDGTAKELKFNCEQVKGFFEDEHDALIIRANDAARKLQDIFADLQAGPRKRDAVVKTIKSRWKRHEIESLQQEVAECRQLLQARLVVLMAGKTMSVDVTKDTQDAAMAHKASVEEVANTMRNALWYPELFARQDRIAKAHDTTFQWVFEDPEERGEKRWDSFKSWLEEGEGIYWISGKAGSGKSTLINYIKDEGRTLRALEDWAQLAELVVGTFFFWNSGSQLQKSLEGLYRSLISQILEKTPTAVELLFTPQDVVNVKQLVLPAGRDVYWSEQKLAVALRRLAAAPTRFERYCFFIDGLDEFDGDHDLLVDVLENLASAKHIKVCCSSRPLQAFTESFADRPGLRLQDLTAGDIRTYVDDTLKSSRKGRKFAHSKPTAFKKLISDIVKKAQGVFLWVYLVVQSLQTGLRNGDTDEELVERVNDSPDDLLGLFGKMVTGLELRYKAQGAMIFRTVFAAPDADKVIGRHSPAISILDLFLASEANVKVKALVRVPGQTKWDVMIEKVHDFEQRVSTTCCGLLEFSSFKGEYRGEWLETIIPEIAPVIRSSPRLLHQSVQEFLTDQEVVQGKLMVANRRHASADSSVDFSIEPQFEDYERLLAARVIAMKLVLKPGMENAIIQDLADYAFAMARHMEMKTGKTNTILIEEIWNACSAYASPVLGRTNWISPKNQTGLHIVQTACHVLLGDKAEDAAETVAVLDGIDLLGYAIAFHLYIYASTKIANDQEVACRERTPSLLHIMMFFDWTDIDKTVAYKPWQQLLRQLLNHGADPNLEFRGRTPWNLRLNMQGEEGHMLLLGTISEDLYELVNHGANINQMMQYKGFLGPLAKVENPSQRVRIQDYDDEISLDYVPSDGLASLDVTEKRSTHENVPEAVDLFQILQEALHQQGLRSKSEHSPEDKTPHDFQIADFCYLCAKSIAAQKTEMMEKESFGISDTWLDPNDEPILAFPVWSISLLQWVNECLVQTEDVKKFSQLLSQRGATIQEPQIVQITALRGFLDCLDQLKTREKVGKEDEDDFDFTIENLDDTQSRIVTAAWRRAFPDYIIAGLPREVNRLLAMVNRRVHAPGSLGAKGSMQVSHVANGMLGMLAAGMVPTTGIHVDGTPLDPMTEACGRIIGALEVVLMFGNRLDEIGGLGGLLGIAGPEELHQEDFWGESQACSVM